MKSNCSTPLSLFGFLALLLLLTACSPTIYNANSLNVPLLSKQGNTKIAIGTAIGGDGVGLYNSNLQAAVGVTDHVGLMVNGLYNNFRRTYTPLFATDTETDRHKERFVEAGLGYYAGLGESNDWRWECYGGYGMGKTRETDLDNNSNVILTSKYHRMFVQPSIGFASEYFDAALSGRFSYLWVGTIDWPGDVTDGQILQGGLFEPCLTIKAGAKGIKPFLQYSWLIFDDELSPAIGLEGFLAKLFTVQIGISVSLKD